MIGNYSHLCDILKHFHILSEMLSGSKFVSGSNFFAKICEIKFRMRKWLGCGDPVIEKMSATMIEKCDKYWSDLHELMALATILDPRVKTEMLHVCYGVLFGKENAVYHVRKSVDFLHELVNEYKKVQNEEEGMEISSPSSLISDELSSIFKELDASIEAETAERMEHELEHYLEKGCLRCVDNNKFDVLSWWEMDGISQIAYDSS